MISRRNWILRCALAGLVLYLFTHITIRSSASDFISELQQSGRSLAELDRAAISSDTKFDSSNEINKLSANKISSSNNKEIGDSLNNDSSTKITFQNVESAALSRDLNVFLNTTALNLTDKSLVRPIAIDEIQAPILSQRFLDENIKESNIFPSEDPLVNETPEVPKLTLSERLLKVLNCKDRQMIPKTQQRGDYWVLNNYIRAEKTHACHESITYTTHGDYTFLDNVVPILQRWKGPISIALHAPGTDFMATIQSIKYLRDCTIPEMKKYATFHIYFSTKHVPKQVPKPDRVLSEPFNCSFPAPFLNVNVSQMYKTQKKLLYPVNVGRNVAREAAQTHFLLASDIELYPSLNLIQDFLEMIADNKGPLLRANPRVHVLPVFEVDAKHQVPANKKELQKLLKSGIAIPFHENVCSSCHNVPHSNEWRTANVTKGLHVLHVGKRTGRYVHWEPIYIGTHADPLYDERLSWEGKSDKMTQGYALCVLDYDFQILDNAFMCHKPGIKFPKKDTRRALLSGKTNQLIRKIIFPELKILYGVRKGCAV